MKEVSSLRKDIKQGKFLPIYFLEGEEPYFIDEISNDLVKYVLTEDEKVFNEHILYGNETTIEDIVMTARQFPMMANKRLIVVKEAQNLQRSIDKLTAYAENPAESTVLVFNYKYKTLDGRLALAKKLKKAGYLLTAKKLYENQIPGYITQMGKSASLEIPPDVALILSQYIGDDLSRIGNELQKLEMILGKGAVVTMEDVERHIGISKEYNIFELIKALSYGNQATVFKILNNFGQNPKEHVFVKYSGFIANTFSNLLVYHTLADKSDRSVASALKINPFFVKDYHAMAKHFPIKKTTAAISHLRTADMKSKGVGSSQHVNDVEIMQEFVMKLFYA
ncbi:MAG: DNA polymerase III subunit delta [Weeksellaceae bacterium]|nr:DNA polymerase III subunit delta [Weeksellaceae bacterium]